MFWPAVNNGLSGVDFPLVLALSDYKWPISSLLMGLKFSARLPNAHALAKLFSQTCLDSDRELPELIIPIPLHKNRYLLRKYNQSTEICKQIGKINSIPVSSDILHRHKATKKQTDLSAVARRKNIKGAFSLAKNADKTLSQYTHVALFDDVITTGSTINMAYRVLHKKFPKLRIDVWSICIALVH